ncbi:MAG: hypothetical protein U0939_03175 [Pirellulales bacterium]
MVAAVAVAVALAPLVARADTVETFEGPDVSWRLSESDCQAQAVVHQRRLQGAHSGQGCEYIRLLHGQGSAIYLTHRIDPSPIIAEWSPRLWLKSDRPGLQMMARVVLPRTLDPRTGRPLTTFLFGNSYSETTLWQLMKIDAPVLALERQVRALRSQWGRQIDARQAYVDMLVLNAYAHGGATQIWIDDLEVLGHVDIRVAPAAIPFSARPDAASPDSVRLDAPRPSLGSPPPDSLPHQPGPLAAAAPPSRPIQQVSWEDPASAPSSPPRSAAPVRLEGALLTVENRPFLPRVIRWRGEPFDWLQELGFNTLLLADRPTPEQIAEARRRGLWLMTPPPRRAPQDAAAPDAPPSLLPVVHPEDEDRILAWHVGEAPDLQLPDVTDYRHLWSTQVPLARRRPVVATAASSLHEWSRHVDVLAADLWSTAHIGAAGAAKSAAAVDVGTSLGLLSDVRTGVPVWSDVPLPRLPDQLPNVPAKGAPAPAYAEQELIRVRWSVYQALSDGARGFIYSAPDSLEPGRAELRPLLTTIRTLNAELALLEPWIAANDGIDLATPSDARYQVRILHNDRARLAIVLRDAGSADLHSVPERTPRRSPRTFPSASLASSVSFVDPGATNGAEAYEVTPSGLRPLLRRRVAGGVEVTLERTPAFSLVLLTQQPVVINYMTRRLAAGRGSPAFR